MARQISDVFTFADFVQNSLRDEKTREDILKYGQHYGSLEEAALEDTEFYKNYLSQFDLSGIKIMYPEDGFVEYDFDLLALLVIASFSCDYEFQLDEEWKSAPQGEPMVDLVIFVEAEEGSTQKNLKDLWSYQIHRLFSIYLNEQVRLSSMIAEDMDNDAEDVTTTRQEYLEIFDNRKKQLLDEAEWHRKMAAEG